MKISHYKMGWIGIRASKLGKASKILKNTGWMRLDAAQLNNRNGFDWVVPIKDHAKFNAMDWRTLANAGLEGIAIWICDAQWGKNAAVTDKQWQNRAIIEADFNSKWPNGHRN